MYVASKRNSHWYGPFSKAERPDGWTRDDERDWMDHLHFSYFSYDTWQNIWSRIPVTYWESRVPNWRDSIERLYAHYIQVDPSFRDEDHGHSHTESSGPQHLPSHDDE
jgi:hypothetical protein